MLTTLSEWNTHLSWGATALAIGYAVYLTYKINTKPNEPSESSSSGKINHTVSLDNTKVVHNFDIEDLEKKSVFCRCWKSNKFPYCDGSHNQHNNTTGDNVGPLIIQKSA